LLDNKICPVCGKEFRQNRKQQKYCCPGCYDIAKKRREAEYYKLHEQEYKDRQKARSAAKRSEQTPSQPIIKVCPVCGKEYEARRSNQEYCCRACWTKADQRKRKAATLLMHNAIGSGRPGYVPPKRKKKAPAVSLDEAIRISRGRNVTYGEAVARGLI